MSRILDVTTSLLASVARGGAGLTARPGGKQPEQLLSLYEFEACPYCRFAREALTELDLDAMIYPCPKGGTRFRPIVVDRGGKAMFPFLVDPNTGTELYESAEIARYLAREYGTEESQRALERSILSMPSSMAASVFRPTRGLHVVPARSPKHPLDLWSFEASPFCRLVREALCSLEIPYVLHNVGKKSRHRASFIALSGKMQVPYLVDPNTGTKMFESADIVAYLNKTYGATRVEP